MSIELPAGVVVGQRGELDVVQVETASCTAELAVLGAIVTRWQPTGHDPVLFAGQGLDYRPGVSMHAGVPLCGPWFGPGRSLDREPAHGFYRSALWRLIAVEQTGSGQETVTVLRLVLTADDMADLPEAAGWPEDASLLLEVSFGSQLTVSLTTSTGADGLDLEEALHTYLRVGDARQIRLQGLDRASYIDKVDGARRTQLGDLTLDQETDRVYSSGSEVVVLDPVLGRRLTVAKRNSASTVVWNPWDVKGPALADVGQEWPNFVCVETANVMDDAATIPSDTDHTISTTISVARL